MIDLFFEGGWLFMSLISLMAIGMLFFAARTAARAYGSGADPRLPEAGQLYYIRYFGMLALVVGVLGQIIGLYEAMKVISQGQEMSQAMLAGGIKVSSITTLYGFFVFLIAHLIWLVLDMKSRSREPLSRAEG